MNRYDLERAVKIKYSDRFNQSDYLNIKSFSRTNIKWVERHYRIERITDAGRVDWSYEADPNRYYFYKDTLFAIQQSNSPQYPGEFIFMLIDIDHLPINAIANAIRTIVNHHSQYLVDVKGMNTGTYKVVQIENQPFRYVSNGAVIRLVERPTLLTEEFLPYKRPEITGEPNSDW